MSDNASNGMTAIVAIIAIIVILGIGYFVVQNYSAAPAADSGPSINVDLPGGQQ